jgi:hypothetical protein
MMRFRNCLYSILFCCSVGFSVYAAEEKPAYAFYLVTCGNYIEHRTQKNEIHRAEDMYYVAGWLSAYNHFAIAAGNVAENTDIDGVLNWMEKYCRNNPLGNMESGLYQMTQELNQNNSQSLQDTTPKSLIKAPKKLSAPSFPEIPR